MVSPLFFLRVVLFLSFEEAYNLARVLERMRMVATRRLGDDADVSLIGRSNAPEILLVRDNLVAATIANKNRNARFDQRVKVANRVVVTFAKVTSGLRPAFYGILVELLLALRGPTLQVADGCIDIDLFDLFRVVDGIAQGKESTTAKALDDKLFRQVVALASFVIELLKLGLGLRVGVFVRHVAIGYSKAQLQQAVVDRREGAQKGRTYDPTAILLARWMDHNAIAISYTERVVLVAILPFRLGLGCHCEQHG